MTRRTNEAVHFRISNRAETLARRDAGWMMRWQSWLVILVAGFIFSASPMAWSADVHVMELTHHEFEPFSFKPKPGDRIDIQNHSDIVHAIYVTYPDGKIVNLTETAAQLPGTTVSWTVPEDAEDGDEYVMRCWIHTIIRADLKVNHSASQVRR